MPKQTIVIQTSDVEGQEATGIQICLRQIHAVTLYKFLSTGSTLQFGKTICNKTECVPGIELEISGTRCPFGSAHEGHLLWNARAHQTGHIHKLPSWTFTLVLKEMLQIEEGRCTSL